MQKQNENGAIRLTSKTALALRRYAKMERTMALCAAMILSLLMAALAVLLGLRWLIAVPIITAAAVLMDAAIFIRSRSRFLSLTAQAMCAEAAARQLREERKEKRRRDQAIRDLAGMKEDLRLDEAPETQSAPPDEEEAPREETQGEDPFAADGEEAQTPRRRRRQATLTVLRKEDAK